MKFLIRNFINNEFPDQGFKQYIEQNKIFITLPKENQNKILEIAKDLCENNVNAPFVGNYSTSNTGHGAIAVRRSVPVDIFKELTTLGNNGKNNVFCTSSQHDTSIKEDGSFIPSASQYEYLIVMALNYNYYCKVNNKSIDDFYNLYIGDITDNENILQYYKDNKELIDGIIKPLLSNTKLISNPFYKLQGNGIKVSNSWIDDGNYKGKSANITPKTDISNLGNTVRISLKKFDLNKSSNNAQLMSGAYNEMLATLNTALKKANVPQEDSRYLRYILNILEKQNGFTQVNSSKTISDLKKYLSKCTPEQIEEDEQLKQLNSDLNKANHEQDILTRVITELCKKNKNFKYELVYEAATGHSKFGSISNAVPNYVLLWTDLYGEIDGYELKRCKLYTIGNYIKHILDHVNVTINFKGSGTNSWTVMRLLN